GLISSSPPSCDSHAWRRVRKLANLGANILQPSGAGFRTPEACSDISQGCASESEPPLDGSMYKKPHPGRGARSRAGAEISVTLDFVLDTFASNTLLRLLTP